MDWIFVLQVASTLMMTGIIWFVQLVHYPLFGLAGEDRFLNYASFHTRRTGSLVAPLMSIELATAVLLCFRGRRFGAGGGVILLGVIWASTAWVHVPLHNLLAKGFDAHAIDRMVRTNWIRTIAWSLRAGLVLWWLRSA